MIFCKVTFIDPIARRNWTLQAQRELERARGSIELILSSRGSRTARFDTMSVKHCSKFAEF